jgi:hypothetical protein
VSKASHNLVTAKGGLFPLDERSAFRPIQYSISRVPEGGVLKTSRDYLLPSTFFLFLALFAGNGELAKRGNPPSQLLLEGR